MNASRRLVIGGVVVAMLGIPAAAGAAWAVPVKLVAKTLVRNYKTSDGVPLAYVVCQGNTSGAHAFRHGRWYFHKFGCAERDTVNRIFDVRVTVFRSSLPRVVEYACSSTYSSYSCPGGLASF